MKPELISVYAPARFPNIYNIPQTIKSFLRKKLPNECCFRHFTMTFYKLGNSEFTVPLMRIFQYLNQSLLESVVLLINHTLCAIHNGRIICYLCISMVDNFQNGIEMVMNIMQTVQKKEGRMTDLAIYLVIIRL